MAAAIVPYLAISTLSPPLPVCLVRSVRVPHRIVGPPHFTHNIVMSDLICSTSAVGSGILVRLPQGSTGTIKMNSPIWNFSYQMPLETVRCKHTACREGT
eukprot:763908-Hanusia_phi.AAC.11